MSNRLHLCFKCNTLSSKAPPCFKFNPTERELVELYLIRKALGLELPYGHEILERPLYGDEAAPWKVFSDDDPWQYVDDTMRKKIIFVFSRVIAKNGQSKSRTVRTAGCGTWDGKAVGKPIKDAHNNVIGSKRAFTFKPKKEFENETRGKWIMHEYSLPSNREYKDGDVVVCRISNHVEKEDAVNEDDGSGVESDEGSNSVEKMGKKKGNKRGRREGVVSVVEKTGNQEGGQGVETLGLTFNVPCGTDSANVSGVLRVNGQETRTGGAGVDETGNQDSGRLVGVERIGLTFNVPCETDSANVSGLRDQETVYPRRTEFAQENENQEIVPYSEAARQDLHYSENNERPTPVLYNFFI